MRDVPSCGPWVARAVRDGASDSLVERAYRHRFESVGSQDDADRRVANRRSRSAPVTIVDIADFECPHCREVVPRLDAMLSTYPGQVRLVYKAFVLSFHAQAEPAARAAFAAGEQGKFWEMEHILFERQQHLEDSDIERYAKMLKLDVPKWKASLHSPAVKARLEKDGSSARPRNSGDADDLYQRPRTRHRERGVARRQGGRRARWSAGRIRPWCGRHGCRRFPGRRWAPLTPMRPSTLAVRVSSLAMLVAGLLGCVPEPTSRPAAPQTEDLPGVDTKDLTPRERHEFSEFVKVLPAPCASVAVPVGECVALRRPCRACVPAAQSVAQLVREGMAREQVEVAYKRRFDPGSVREIPLEGSPSRGPANARVVVVEFADFECPFCQQMASVLDAMWEKRQNEVRFVYKFMPLAVHPARRDRGAGRHRGGRAGQVLGDAPRPVRKRPASRAERHRRLRRSARPRLATIPRRHAVARDDGSHRCGPQSLPTN